jgi:phosphatidylserine/phosphatidylglycerophosphate/cardiolipin synthase-like enzyme
MKNVFKFMLLFFFIQSAWALRLSDYTPFEFEVLFTNPVCATYEYERPAFTRNGEALAAKPKNVYCKNSDEAASVARPHAPQFRLVQWISDPATTEVRLAFLSFRNSNIVTALCQAARRGVKIHLILDGGHGESREAEGLKLCGQAVNVDYRGSTGGLGFAHNKFMVVNPGKTPVRIVFSSGNMTTGTSINHENWNFVTTSAASYFAQDHHCAFSGMVEAGSSRTEFNTFMQQCRKQIKAKPESDVEVFFVPADARAAQLRVSGSLTRAQSVDIMAHRFSGMILDMIKKISGQKPVRLIMDDDVYWSRRLRRDIGRNQVGEAFKIFDEVTQAGAETRYLETNQNIFQLQHNKFLIFDYGSAGAVFTGAGNLTSSAFTKNFENFYYITIPAVVEAYREQYRKYFFEMATTEEDMPRDYIMP